jgi:S-adenosylmethionine:tRNA ribosyltransferase-isomerase
MRTDLFDYELPPDRIAQTPLPRGQSRLLVLHRDDGRIEHRQFSDLLEYLHPGDTLVLNDTRVTARRLEAKREGGYPAEVILLQPLGETGWEALVRPGKSLRPGKTLLFRSPAPDNFTVPAQVIATTPWGGRHLDFSDRSTRDLMAAWGLIPLPPYIHIPLSRDQEEHYQTVYASQNGSAAAPTAGLHFTTEMLSQAQERDVGLAHITLHVGIDTFRPVRTEFIEEHAIHGERVWLSAADAQIINETRGRVIAVGTTSVRTLESAAMIDSPARNRGDNRRLLHPRVRSFSGETHLFITPGYHFQAVDALITNFHLPRSTLLVLVSAFASRERILQAYAEAIREGYRFFSFGDAMLIV